MTRRRRRALILVSSAALALLLAALLPFASRRALELRLGAALGRPVALGALRYHLFPLEVELLELRVAGATPEAPPFLEVGRAVVVPSLGLSPRLTLARVRLERPTIRVHAFKERGDDLPRLRGGSGGAGLRVRRLLIQDGELLLEHERIPLSADLPELEGRLVLRRGELAGSLRFGPGRLRFGDAPELPVGAELELALAGSELRVTSGRVRARDTELSVGGAMDLAAGLTGSFALSGPVALAELDRHVLRTGFALAGAGRFRGTLRLDRGRLALEGSLTGEAGSFDGVAVPRFAAEVERDARGVRLRELDAELLGGRGRFEIDVPPGAGPARLEASLDGVDAEGALAAIFDIGAAGLDASASGEVSIEWPRGRIRELSGRIELALLPRGDGRTPLAGRFAWQAEGGLQRIESADLRTPATWAHLSGSIALDGTTQLALDADSSDLAASDELLLRVRRALLVPEPAAFGVAGSGSFRGRWTGALGQPVFEGRFAGREIAYRGVAWGRAEWAGRLDATAIESRSLVLRRAGAELWLDGRTETGALGERDAMELSVRFGAWPAEDFRRALELETQLAGPVTGEARLSGRRSAPLGSLRLTLQEGSLYGVPLADLDATLSFEGPLTRVSQGRARVGGGSVAFAGSVTQDDVYDAEARAWGVDVAALQGKRPLRLSGRVSGELSLRGTLGRPRLLASVSSPRLFFGDEGLGAVRAELSGDGDGALRLVARARSARLDAELSGTLGAAAPHDAELLLEARDTSLDPFLRVAYPALPAAVALLATGQVALAGPLSAPRELRWEAGLPGFELRVPEYALRNVGPLRLRGAAGRVAIEALRLAGEGTDLELRGGAALVPDQPMDLSVAGAADLRALAGLSRRLRGRGAARLAMTVTGTRAAPEVTGRLDLEGAGLRLRGLPLGVEDVRGRVAFDQDGLRFEGVRGTLGGGEVEMAGEAGWGASGLRAFDVRGSGRGLTVRYPEGLRSVVDAELRAFGDAQQQWITGSVEVRQATWTRRYDVASELLSASAEWEPAARVAQDVRYDLRLRAPGTLRIDNNLATLDASAELSVQGTLGAPLLLGRAEIERGRVYFQGNTYLIRRGTIDFSDPRRIDPQFDIEAETRIRSYRVTLRVSGTLSRVYPTLSSDPPLSAVQILSLLAGADEAAVTSLATAQADQARLAASGAATLAAGRLAEEVGLPRGAERLFGLSRFSIDPSLLRGGAVNPSARLSLGKRITPSLSVLYSLDLRGVEDRVLSVEYTLSDRLSVLLTQSAPGGVGFDVLLRQARR